MYTFCVCVFSIFCFQINNTVSIIFNFRRTFQTFDSRQTTLTNNQHIFVFLITVLELVQVLHTRSWSVQDLHDPDSTSGG